MKRPDFTGISSDVAEYITSLEDRIEDITQMFQNLQRLYFGRKSEKIRIPAMEDGAEQLSIFSQETVDSAPQPMVAEPETVGVSGYKRKKKRTQEEIIADLPIVVHEHAIPQDELHCPRCGNEELEYNGIR